MVIHTNITVFWDLMSCGLIDGYQHFGGGKKNTII